MATTKSNLRTASLVEIHGEIQRRRRDLETLVQRRTKLIEQVKTIDGEISRRGLELGGMANVGMSAAMRGAPTAGIGRKRPRNDLNLADSLVDVLSKQTLSVTNVAEEVQAQGYHTTSPNFRTIVNQTLIKDPRIKRVGRGLYTSKGGGKNKK